MKTFRSRDFVAGVFVLEVMADLQPYPFEPEPLREMSCVVVLKSYDTDPYFSKIRRGTAIKTRDLYVGWPDPYLFRFGLFPMHGKSDFRTRH